MKAAALYFALWALLGAALAQPILRAYWGPPDPRMGHTVLKDTFAYGFAGAMAGCILAFVSLAFAWLVS